MAAEEVVAAHEYDTAAVGRKSRIAFTFERLRQTLRGARLSIIDENVAFCLKDLSAEARIVNMLTVVPAREPGRGCAGLLRRNLDRLRSASHDFIERIGRKHAFRIPPGAQRWSLFGPPDSARPRADPGLRRLHDLVDGEFGLLGPPRAGGRCHKHEHGNDAMLHGR